MAPSEGPMEVRVADGKVTIATGRSEVTVLEGISASLSPLGGTGEVVQGAVVLTLRDSVPGPRLQASLGRWAPAQTGLRWMAGARCKLWWMTPAWGAAADPIPTETQFLLARCELGDVPDVEAPFVFFLPLVTGSFRSTLQAEGTNGLSLVTESADTGTQAAHVHAVVVAAADGPYEALRLGFRMAKQILGGAIGLREDKKMPKSMQYFGWCTWDAFMDKARYTSLVTPDGIVKGIEGFAAGGIKIRHLIIDDGWQTVGNDIQTEKEILNKSPAVSPMNANAANNDQSPAEQALLNTGAGSPQESPTAGERPNRAAEALFNFYTNWVEHAPAGSVRLDLWAALCRCFATSLRHSIAEKGVDQAKRLRSVFANSVFENAEGRSLKKLVSALKEKHGVRSVYCWHHLLGYWCGLEPTMAEFGDLKVQKQPFVLAPGIQEVEPQQRWGFCKSMEVGLPAEQDGAAQLYDRMHSYLKEAGVDGVKVDGQACIGQCGQGTGGGPALSRHWITALEDSVEKYFGSPQCITCMCHANENLFNYRRSSVCRASDDFFPDNVASQAAHIAHGAFNAVFLSEIAMPDWDMFHSDHPSGQLHGAARAVSGGAVYVSDPPGEHDFGLLHKLVTADGRVLLCDGPARPTRDCLFDNPQLDGLTALKVYNTNGGGALGVVAAFNVQGAHWDRVHRKFELLPHRLTEVLVETRPRDVEDFRSQKHLLNVSTGYAMHRCSKPQEVELVRDGNTALSFALPTQGFEVITYSPILKIQTKSGAFSVAPIGLWKMFNPGGAVRSVRAGGDGVVEILGHGNGLFLSYASTAPKVCQLLPDPEQKQDQQELALVPLVLNVRELALSTSSNSGPSFEVEIPDVWAAVDWILRWSW